MLQELVGSWTHLVPSVTPGDAALACRPATRPGRGRPSAAGGMERRCRRTLARGAGRVAGGLAARRRPAGGRRTAVGCAPRLEPRHDGARAGRFLTGIGMDRCDHACPDRLSPHRVPICGATAAGALLRPDPRLVRGDLRGADRGPGARLGRHRRGPPHADPRADRQRQDPRRVPVVPRPAGSTQPAADAATRQRPRPLRLAAQGARPTTSSATCARRWPGSPRGGARGWPSRPGASRSRSRTGDTPADERRQLATASAGHPRHDARSRSTCC